MSFIDWAVFNAFLVWIVVDGLRRAHGTNTLETYFAGGRTVSWWAAGLSIMATQASAITVIGTTGQGYETGMEFVQTYFGLAFAMVLLSIFFVPLYRAQPILTAYEFLERRFGPATRTLAALIFLVSRCLAFGVVLYAPSVVMSAMLGIPLTWTVLGIGALTTLYTTVGGVRAVIATDVKQMLVIIGGLLLILVLLLVEVVPALGFTGALRVLGATGKLNAVEFVPESLEFVPQLRGSAVKSFWNEKYNFWSGTLGGLFLMLSYFGCDQTQVQRILTNPTADESRKALLMSAFAKVPMQAGVLFLGVLLYLFYVLQGPPLLFDPSHVKKAGDAPLSSVIAPIEADHRGAAEQLRRLAGRIASGDANGAEVDAFRRAVATERRARSAARREVLLHDPEVAALAPAQQKARKTPNDTNYIFPHFVLSHVPMVFVGLIMAAIFAAMMSSADSTLNALTASSIVDIYRRWLRPAATEAQALRASRVTSVLWGLAATGAALLFRGTGSVIEVVNQIGSFFYGSLLGVFVLAMVAPRAGPRAGVIGLCGGMLSVLATYWFLSVEFLWFNVIGCVGVLVFGGVASAFDRRR